ncbi:MAG: response regulator [Acidobacteria bacterium]|nr:response regulator [Acidobacteriota bacterium]MXZ73261.1 response regulator [Acidobacteriota bacterium]MYJ02779.1 response regulator [Acidobacteriota bacterium]
MTGSCMSPSSPRPRWRYYTASSIVCYESVEALEEPHQTRMTFTYTFRVFIMNSVVILPIDGFEPYYHRHGNESHLNGPDELKRENAALRDRISALSAAILRISASLDVHTVLREVVDSACALIGARYGVITTVDDAGQPQEFVTSGFTPEERQELVDWPEGPQLFAHFKSLTGAVRLNDLHAYVRSLGFAPDLMREKTLAGTPMRHHGAHVGSFFLNGKQGGPEFTREDEEILVLFASQAAAAITNARKHRDEQRARADLEALVDTSPVGVAVFDARTGHPVLFNREAKRIVGSLAAPDRPPEELLGVLICRRADGREVALDEFPLAEQWTDPETVRAEEMVLSVPDGRSVRTLVNATPIRSADGAVESMIVTLQDLAPLEELEHLRAEFLSMVSHELRVPLTSIMGSTAAALGAAPPDPAETRQFFRIIDEQADHMRGLINDLLDAGRIETGTLTIAPAATEVAGLVDEARTTYLSGGGRHPLEIDLPADLPQVMADRQRIVQVLNNLLSNAARHAPSSSPIRVAAERDGVYVAVSVSDEGRGVPADRLPLLFRKRGGFAAADPARGSGGLGLGICKGLVEAHGGRIWAESEGSGLGTRFSFTIPVADEAAAATPAGSGADASPPDDGRTRVLVLDDDPQTLRSVRDALTAAGYSPVVTGDPEELARLVETKQPQLVLLDLKLPGADGIELMHRVPELAELPVIFISGYGRDETIARALQAGAADYIVKPFSPTELTARVRATLRRLGDVEPFRLGDLAIHYEERRVTVAGRTVRLTATEYELLRALSLNPRRVHTYDALLGQVWRGKKKANVPRLRAYVKRLRHKLGDDAERPAYIVTERRVGYRMARPDDP